MPAGRQGSMKQRDRYLASTGSFVLLVYLPAGCVSSIYRSYEFVLINMQRNEKMT